MNFKRSSSVALLSLVSTLNFASAVDDIDITRPSLKGIKAVQVGVRISVTESAKGLIDEDLIQTDVELRLRKAGILVHSKKDTPNILDSRAFINVDLTVVGAGQGWYAVHWDVEVEQATRLARDPSIIAPLAATWSTGRTGVLNSPAEMNITRKIRDQLADSIDEFINAYLSVNPKK